MRERSAIVAGGGIAGLSASLALARAGFAVELFERAERIAAIGAGLQLSPNALSVLARLGLADKLSGVAVGARLVTLRDGRSGREIARIPVESAGGHGYLSLHRADLQVTLLDAVEREPSIRLTLGRTLCAIEDHGDRVEASFARPDGTAERQGADLLVAADGVHSRAASLLGFRPPWPTGAHAHRFAIAPGQGPAGTGGIEAWLGPRRHAVSYPIRHGGDRNLVLIQPAAENDMSGFGSWDPRVAELISAAAYLGEWPILTVDARERVAPSGRVVLIGDAAHAMPPYAAQGAAMAIEDAWVLAVSLAQTGGQDAALCRYAEIRAPRLARVAKRVSFHRLVYHLPRPLSLARDAALALRSPASLRHDLGWLYDWSAPPIDAVRG